MARKKEVDSEELAILHGAEIAFLENTLGKHTKRSALEKGVAWTVIALTDQKGQFEGVLIRSTICDPATSAVLSLAYDLQAIGIQQSKGFLRSDIKDLLEKEYTSKKNFFMKDFDAYSEKITKPCEEKVDTVKLKTECDNFAEAILLKHDFSPISESIKITSGYLMRKFQSMLRDTIAA